MKAIVAAALALLGGMASASASSHYVTTYHDLIRPHGHPRPDAVYRAALAACGLVGADTGEARDSPAFVRCMRTRHYRLQSVRVAHTPSARPTEAGSSLAARGWYNNPDPDNPGTICHDFTFLGIVGNQCQNFDP